MNARYRQGQQWLYGLCNCCLRSSRGQPANSRRHGAAVVEFAVVTPVLLLLVFGILEFGRSIMVLQVLQNASREGARVAVIDDATVERVHMKVRQALQGSSVGEVTLTIAPADPRSAGYDEPVTVTVEVPFKQISWLPAPFLVDGDTPLRTSTTMRRETVK